MRWCFLRCTNIYALRYSYKALYVYRGEYHSTYMCSMKALGEIQYIDTNI